MELLPQVPPRVSLLLVGLSLLPPTFSLLRDPHPRRLPAAVAFALLSGFWFGYHVHEKAFLPVSSAVRTARARARTRGFRGVLWGWSGCLSRGGAAVARCAARGRGRAFAGPRVTFASVGHPAGPSYRV